MMRCAGEVLARFVRSFDDDFCIVASDGASWLDSALFGRPVSGTRLSKGNTVRASVFQVAFRGSTPDGPLMTVVARLCHASSLDALLRLFCHPESRPQHGLLCRLRWVQSVCGRKNGSFQFERLNIQHKGGFVIGVLLQACRDLYPSQNIERRSKSGCRR